jgi:poly-gamma-glutamate synthesis protein (capsule biosynthesis protein)
MYRWHMLLIGVTALSVLGAGVIVYVSRVDPDSACPEAAHYSYFSTAEVFDDAYETASSTKEEGIEGLLVNHHLLAAHLIAEGMNKIATEEVQTVVLISPNHFARGTADAISSTAGWNTPYGVLETDCGAIERLAARGVLAIEEPPLDGEHGISGIVPFIKRSLPNARVVPIIVKDGMDAAERNALVEALHREFKDEAIIIGSFDFSHYLPDYASDFHDEKAIAVIERFDYEGLQVLDTDSVPGIEVMLRLLEHRGATNADIYAHTNAQRLLQNPALFEGTSYITATFAKGDRQENTAVTILSFGDMMLDRAVRKRIATEGPRYPFAPLERFLIGSDLVVANAEGPFTHNESVSAATPESLIFTFAPELAPVLARLGFTHLSQANNHSLNFGGEGLRESLEHIAFAGMRSFGTPQNVPEQPVIETVRGQAIALVGYHQFAPDDGEVFRTIAEAKKRNAYVIVYPHWGIEYEAYPSAFQVEKARTLIDAGADLVLGAHPHVIQPVEIYKGKAIFYSLGNFVFDQASIGPTAEGLAIGSVVRADTVTFTLMPVRTIQSQVSLMLHKERDKLMKTMADRAILPPAFEYLRPSIATGTFTITR